MPPTPERQPQRRLSLQLEGLVQGVGLRPFLHRLATERGLRGWVRNGSQGVELELEGEISALTAFVATLRDQPPPRCRIDRLQQVWGAARGDLGPFQITGVTGSTGPLTALVSPDLAICRACLAELADPGSRRHRYPFISCTDCGPRYSLLLRLPFEREHTALAAFPLCPACRRDYADPADRRFHAQTISCPACGPRLRWQVGDEPDVTDQDAISAAAVALRRGAIVAVQSIGGFQLLVDPHNAAAVAELRRRKGRPDKPLALLASADWLEQHCRLSALERRLWWSPAAPILLVRRRHKATALAAGVAPESPWLGVMRPASALQQLLLDDAGPVLVATSANRSGEPIAADAEADGELLAHLADGLLRHDLPIVNRSDDSVLRTAAGRPLVLRLGRGLAPLALHHDTGDHGAEDQEAARDNGRLALGAQVKGSLALQLPQTILLSPDLGDLGSSAGAEHLHRTVMAWLQRHRLQPCLIACDRHRGYRASQLAAALAQQGSAPLLPVQHHHAHLLAVQAEHDLTEHSRGGERIGVAWDGAGLGDDDSLWGGEGLAVSAAGYRRLARLRPFRLPGGERALREPRRAALGLLFGAWGPSWRGAALAHGPLPCLEAFSAAELATLELALLQGFNSPLCSSIGRLFDAVAALLGLRQVCSHEAQAAIALEGLATQALSGGCGGDGRPVPRYRLPLRSVRGWQPGNAGAPLEWDWRPLLTALLRDRAGACSPAAIALALHRALADAIVALAVAWPDACATDGLLLGGGCFQNALLLELSVRALKARGIQAHWPQQLPCNDAALAVGQLLAAANTPRTGSPPGDDRHVPRHTG